MRPPGTSAACSFARTSWSDNPDVQASMAASSSAARAVLPALSAREGSEARSSRPIARISRLKMLSAFPPMTTQAPSLQRYVFDGVIPGKAPPLLSRT